jgi:hypothetical protein
MPRKSTKLSIDTEGGEADFLQGEESPSEKAIEDGFLPPDWVSQLVIGSCAALFFATLGLFLDGAAGRFVFQILGCAGAIHATGLLHLESYWEQPKDPHASLFGATLFGTFLGHFAGEIILSKTTVGELLRCFVVR